MNRPFAIDEGIRKLIEKLSQEEKAALRASIDEEGCRESLIVWREEKILLDGHHRLEICEDLGKPYRLREKSLASRADAELWVIDNQLSRRNLNNFQRVRLQLKKEPILVKKADERMKAGKKIDPRKNSSQGRVKDDLAIAAGVSHDTVAKVKKIDGLGSARLKRACAEGDLSINIASEIASEFNKPQQDAIVKQGRGCALATAKEIKRERANNRTRERIEAKKKSLASKTQLEGKMFQLYCGDFRAECEQIGEQTVDAIITDPPYGKDAVPLYGGLSEVAARVLVSGGHCLVMTGQAHLAAVLEELMKHLTYQWTLGYFTPGQSTQVFGRRVKSNWKPVIWLTKGKNTWEHVEDTVSSDRNDKRFHEWGQSTAGMAALVERFTVENSLILDPFVGGGATGVAALMTGRCFIGIDTDQGSINTTAKRLHSIAEDD